MPMSGASLVPGVFRSAFNPELSQLNQDFHPRRFVRDLIAFQCDVEMNSSVTASGTPLCLSPLYPSTLFTNIDVRGVDIVLAVDQIGRVKSGDPLYLHHVAIAAGEIASEGNESETKEATVVQKMLSVSNGLGIDLVEVPVAQGGSLPPTPLTSFVRGARELGATTAFTGLVLAGIYYQK
jgi:Nicastrin